MFSIQKRLYQHINKWNALLVFQAKKGDPTSFYTKCFGDTSWVFGTVVFRREEAHGVLLLIRPSSNSDCKWPLVPVWIGCGQAGIMMYEDVKDLISQVLNQEERRVESALAL